jgi:hypothetical protein
MSYFAYDRMGNAIASPVEVAMRNLLGAFAVQDPEHPDVSLNHESGWSASVFGNGLVVLENVETGEGPWHMSGKSPEKPSACGGFWPQESSKNSSRNGGPPGMGPSSG